MMIYRGQPLWCSGTITWLSPQVAGNVQAQDDDKIELVPGTNLFISATRLQQILSTVKTGKQLARKLMSVFWDRNTLARSTLSASSQHYEQLDPSTVSAIKSKLISDIQTAWLIYFFSDFFSILRAI